MQVFPLASVCGGSVAWRGVRRGGFAVTSRARGGFTLVEVMLAGAITVLMTLALMLHC